MPKPPEQEPTNLHKRSQRQPKEVAAFGSSDSSAKMNAAPESDRVAKSQQSLNYKNGSLIVVVVVAVEVVAVVIVLAAPVADMALNLFMK